MRKLKKYLRYLLKFVKSDNKLVIFKELSDLVSKHGCMAGFKHYAEMKSQDEKNIKEECYFFIPVQEHNNPQIETLRPNDDNDFSIKLPFAEANSFECSKYSGKLAVVVHVFYPDLINEIIDYLLNIPFHFKLFISTNTQKKKDAIKDVLQNRNICDVVVKILPNRGRDIAPTIIGFKNEILEHEYFLHLHSKKSPHGALEDWRTYTYENLLGSKEIVASVFYLLSQSNVGIVFPQHFRVLRGCINWGYNFECVRDLLKRSSINISANTLLEFPSGSMFWAKSKALAPLLELSLSFDDFPEEAAQVDGTLAHAIERSLLYFAESKGFTWLKISTGDFEYVKDTVLVVNNNFNDVFRKVYRPLLCNSYLRSKLKLNHVIPETRAENLFPSYNSKPRINLIVNTLNPSQVFGGVNTALKIFNQFCVNDLVDFDCRIIVCDAALDSDALRLYELQYKIITHGMNYDDEEPKLIINNYYRSVGAIFIRPNDIFIATAWWTAEKASRCYDFQNRFFKYAHKFIYLIQDYESNFYPWSTKWQLANNTYSLREQFIPLINAEELVSFMEQFNFDNVFYLPYLINEKVRMNLKNLPRKKQILFYGRPNVARNLFELLIDGLYIWQKLDPIEAAKWEIISLGEEYIDSYVNHVQNVKIKGKVSLEEYATLLSESMLGLSLMCSPHPSYPPLEMAYAGIITITNSYDGKDLSLRSPNIYSIDNISSETLGLKILNLVQELNSGVLINNLEPIKDLPLNAMQFDVNGILNLFHLDS